MLQDYELPLSIVAPVIGAMGGAIVFQTKRIVDLSRHILNREERLFELYTRIREGGAPPSPPPTEERHESDVAVPSASTEVA